MTNLKPIKTYARTIGKKLKPLQRWALEEILPKYKTNKQNLSELNQNFEEVIMEIGFGTGDHLAHQAITHPDKYFVGVEPYLNGVAKMLKIAEEHSLNNLSIYDEDVTGLVNQLPGEIFSKIYILFPDPWPKKRHKKRRLVQTNFISKLLNILKQNGEIRMATDIKDYAGSVVEVLKGFSNLEVIQEATPEPFSEYSQTKYHQKAISEGRDAYFISAVKVRD